MTHSQPCLSPGKLHSTGPYTPEIQAISWNAAPRAGQKVSLQDRKDCASRNHSSTNERKVFGPNTLHGLRGPKRLSPTTADAGIPTARLSAKCPALYSTQPVAQPAPVALGTPGEKAPPPPSQQTEGSQARSKDA